MRKIFTFFSALLVMTSLTAQNAASFKDNFTTGIDIFNDFVQDSPTDINFRTINPGVNLYGMYNYQIPKSKISLAIGLGIGMHNLHSNGLLSDSGVVSRMTAFPKIIGGKDASYKTNKLQLTYLDIPAEIRFKSAGGFRLALGIKAGYLVGAHTKFRGDNPAGGRIIRVKESKLPNLEKWRFGPTFQIGYKFINLTAFYSLSKVFDQTTELNFFPVSIGIALRPF